MSWLRGICFILALTLGSSVPADDATDYKRIRSFLVDPLLDFSGFDYVQVTKTYSYTYAYRQRLNELLDNDRSVQILANLGREFLESYLAQLNNDFPVSSQNLLVYREEEILRRLDQYLQQQTYVPQEKPLTHVQKHTRAWSEALYQLQMPRGTSFEATEKLKKSDFQYAKLHELYGDLYWRYSRASSIERVRQEPKTVTVDDFKKYMSATLTGVRVENFRSAARLADAEDMWTVQQDQAKFSLSAKDFADAKIDFDLKSHRGAARIEKVSTENLRSSIQAWLKKDNWKKETQWRERLKRLFFDYPKYLLSWPAYRVQFTLKDGRVFYFSEQEFNRLIHEFRTYPKENPFSERRDMRMYLVQAAKRDRDLSHLNIQLNHSNDKDFDELRGRLQTHKVRVTPRGGSESGVEDLLYRFGREGLLRDRVAHVSLAGFMIDPEFWQNKAVLNEGEVNKIFYTVDRGVLTDRRKLPDVKHFIRSQLQQWFYNELQVEAQAEPPQPAVAKPIANQAPRRKAVTAWRAAVLAAAVAGGLNYITDGWLVEQFSKLIPDADEIPRIQLQLPQLPQIPQLGAFSFGGGGRSRAVESMNVNEESGNYKSPGGQGNGKNKGPSLYEFDFRNVSPGEIEYLNLTANHNLPVEVLADLNPESEPRSVTPVAFVDTQNYDFSVKSKIPSLMNSGRIAIAQVPGFEISGLEIYEGRAKINHYKVYRVPSSGLTYAEINTRVANGRLYTYQAQYVRKTSRPNIDPALANVDPKAIMPVLKQLERDGFTNAYSGLSAWINSSHNTSWSAYTQTVALAANYSDRTPVKVSAHLASSPFVKSLQYLHNGVLQYQCTGSHEFLASTLELYLKNLEVSYRSDLFVQGVSGYIVKEGHVAPTFAHRHTLMGRHSVPDSVLELDGTPGSSDGGGAGEGANQERQQAFTPQMNERPQSPEPNFAGTPNPPQQPKKVVGGEHKPLPLPKVAPSPHALGVRAPQLPERRTDKFKFIFDDDGSAKNQQEPEKVEEEEEKEVEKPAVEEEKPSLFQRVRQMFVAPPPPPKKYIKVKIKQPRINVYLLKSLMESLQKALAEENKINPDLKKLNLASLPGLEVLTYSRLLLEWTEDKKSEREALEDMLRAGNQSSNREGAQKAAAEKTAAMGGEETWVMGSLIQKAQESFRVVTAKLEQEQTVRSPRRMIALEFLLKPEISRPIEDILSYLNQLKWDNPPQYILVEDTSCTGVLKN